MNPKNFPNRKEEKRIDAQQRAEIRATRSPKQQLERLEQRGHGHCKEAKRLRESLQGD